MLRSHNADTSLEPLSSLEENIEEIENIWKQCFPHKDFKAGGGEKALMVMENDKNFLDEAKVRCKECWQEMKTEDRQVFISNFWEDFSLTVPRGRHSDTTFADISIFADFFLYFLYCSLVSDIDPETRLKTQRPCSGPYPNIKGFFPALMIRKFLSANFQKRNIFTDYKHVFCSMR